MPSDTRVCPFCAERINAAATTCTHCHSALPALGGPPAEHGDEEVLGRDPHASRGVVITAGGILVVILLAYGATLVVASLRPQHPAGEFNLFVNVKNACEKDDGTLVTTDPQGNPMAFATPDGPERYWCVSKRYLTSIGRAPQDPLPSVRRIPGKYKWLWPRTSFGRSG